VEARLRTGGASLASASAAAAAAINRPTGRAALLLVVGSTFTAGGAARRRYDRRPQRAWAPLLQRGAGGRASRREPILSQHPSFARTGPRHRRDRPHERGADVVVIDGGAALGADPRRS
jgi:hypothetical protein